MLSSKVAAGKGAVVTVKPAVFSFDAAHPGLADKHYLRTKEQDRCVVCSNSKMLAGQTADTAGKTFLV
jgi:hypothetical protein